MLLAASLVTTMLVPWSGAWSVRLWMLQAGLPLLALLMAASALSLMRLGRAHNDLELDLDLARLRERLYVVATVGVMVLVPSAVLALRWASAPRPGNAMAIRAVEAIALLIIGLLLLRNAVEAKNAQFPSAD